MQEYAMLDRFDVDMLEQQCKDMGISDFAASSHKSYEEIQKSLVPVHKFV